MYNYIYIKNFYMYIKKNKKYAFTLIELVLVISILSILSFIAYFSLQWYSSQTRDVKRISDINNIKKALWIYIIKHWKYPQPSNSSIITFSWTNLWTQWTFWDWVFKNVKIFNKKPLDPLTWSEYTYSISNNNVEYEISWIKEYRHFQESNIINNALGNENISAYIDWTYNWLISKINIWTISYILALPSITTRSINNTNLETIIEEDKLVYNWYKNLPHSYTQSMLNTFWWFGYNTDSLIIFEWDISDLRENNNQILFLDKLKKAYSWTIISQENWILKTLNDLEIDFINPNNSTKNLACNIINYNLKFFVECNWFDFITFFLTNILHIDISNLPWTKINIAYQNAINWDFWFGTNDGIAKYSDGNWTIYRKNPHDSNSLVNNNVTSITIDDNDNYWFGTVNWVSMFDWNSTWTTYNNNVLVSTHIQYIYTSSDWTIRIWTNWWVSTYSSETWNSYIKKSDWLSSNNITAIFEDNNNDIWFWTNSKWVDKFSDWIITNFTTPNLPSKVITYIFQDINNNMRIWTIWWLAKRKIDWKWEQYTTDNTWWNLPSNKITYIYEDTSNNLWIWMTEWLLKTNYDLTTWKIYNTSSSPIPLAWNEIKNISQDDTGNILILSEWWINTINSEWVIID